MNKTLSLVLNGKGGVGKSFFAVNFVQYLKDHGRKFAVFDTDNENSTLTRFHRDATFIDLEEPRQLDALFTGLDQVPLAVADCRAASTDILFSYFSAVDLPVVLEQLGIRLTVVIPVNHEADSVDQLGRIVEELGERCQYVVLRNEAHTESFTLYEQLKFRPKLLGPMGAKEITMRKLPPWLVESLQHHSVTATGALSHKAFSLLDRQRLRTWQRELYGQIDSVVDRLAPNPTPDDSAK